MAGSDRGNCPGINHIQTAPGLRPEPMTYEPDPHLFEDSNSRQHFSLHFTGSARLAKNILQEVVSHMNTLEPAQLLTLRPLKELARRSWDVISLRDSRGLASVLQDSWEANRFIHPGTSK